LRDEENLILSGGGVWRLREIYARAEPLGEPAAVLVTVKGKSLRDGLSRSDLTLWPGAPVTAVQHSVAIR
jgi:hypothetical protein